MSASVKQYVLDGHKFLSPPRHDGKTVNCPERNFHSPGPKPVLRPLRVEYLPATALGVRMPTDRRQDHCAVGASEAVCRARQELVVRESFINSHPLNF
jgi:hypothetical protein